MGINLLTFNQKTIAPKDDALIQQYALGQDGFFYGGTPTYTGGNTIHFQSGEGMMCGREFVLEDTDVSAALPASGTLLGQVYIHVDLSNTDNPIELICETAETLTELTKDENLNVNNGTYDLQLCTFTANVSNITDLVSQIKQIKKGGGGSDENLAQIEEGTEATRAYVAGEFVVVDGLLRKVLAPIAIGDEFEDDVNEEITNVGAQISAINQNLTNLTNDLGGEVIADITGLNVADNAIYVVPNITADQIRAYDHIVVAIITSDGAVGTYKVLSPIYTKNMDAISYNQILGMAFTSNTLYKISATVLLNYSSSTGTLDKLGVSYDLVNYSNRHLNAVKVIGYKK